MCDWYFTQEKAAFIFCVEDRALYCQDCDESIHSVSALTANHQRYLATGIQVALGSLSKCRTEPEKHCKEPSNQNAQQIALKQQSLQQPSSFSPHISWPVDDLLEFPEFGSPGKVRNISLVVWIAMPLKFEPLASILVCKSCVTEKELGSIVLFTCYVEFLLLV